MLAWTERRQSEKLKNEARLPYLFLARKIASNVPGRRDCDK